ncbi:MAG: 4Fe-4S binding protein [Desulfobacteraceae bacterium]|nr:nitroreductase family protein [Desulfobacteraceae bacterium]MBC2755706.1 4Fe-4S binding protein [Desulfobacteraceae bacterium]
MNAKIRRIEEKCNNCMRCVLDCASGVWKNIDGIPAMTGQDLCNRCSHCVAVCPKNAIENDFLKTAQVRRVKKKLIDPAVYKEIALSRRSIRHYKDKPVEPEILKDIIDVTRYSPTASNSQHVSYIVITDPNILKEISLLVFSTAVSFYKYSTTRSGQYVFKGLKLSAAIDAMLQKYIEPMAYYIELNETGRDLILHNAPVLVLLHGPSMSFFGADNCNIAAANMTNYAHCLGIGSCYIGFVTLLTRFNKKLCRLINLPKGRKVYASLVLGYPALKHPNTVSRKNPNISWIGGS